MRVTAWQDTLLCASCLWGVRAIRAAVLNEPQSITLLGADQVTQIARRPQLDPAAQLSRRRHHWSVWIRREKGEADDDQANF